MASFYIINHDFPSALLDRAFKEAARFHAQPSEVKNKLAINADHSGYIDTGPEAGRSSEYHSGPFRPDVGEALILQRDRAPIPLAVKNQWPEDLPGFRETMVEYFEVAESLFRRLLPIFAVSLDLPPNYFDSLFGEYEAITIVRASHFNANDDLLENHFHLSPHTDSSFATLLPTTEIPGLELLGPSGDEWFAAQPIPNSFLVNSGDVMKRWTNGRFLSTPHRVINKSGLHRYSIPLFVAPNPDVMIECLPTCTGPGNPPKEPPISSNDYKEWFVKENFKHAADDWDDVVE